MTSLDFGDLDDDLHCLLGEDIYKDDKVAVKFDDPFISSADDSGFFKDEGDNFLTSSDDNESRENHLPSVDPQKQSSLVFMHSPVAATRKRRAPPTAHKLSCSSYSQSSPSPFYSTEEENENIVPKRRKKSVKASTQKAQRGRGRPKKEDDDADDDKLIHKRHYARRYRENHQQIVNQITDCATDFYKALIENGINVKKEFPQHSEIIDKISKQMPVKPKQPKAAATVSRRR